MYEQLENTRQFYKVFSLYGLKDLWNIGKFFAFQIMKRIKLLIIWLFKNF